MTLILQGVVHGLSSDAYNAHRSYRNSLSKWLEPEHAPLQGWWHSYLNPERPELKGSNITTGKLLHLAMEDYDTFQRTIRILPDTMRTCRPGSIGGAPGGQLEAILILRAKLLAMPDVQKALAEGHPEASLFAHHPTGYGALPVRSRPDLLSDTVEIHWKSVSRMEYLGHHIDRMRYIEMLAFYKHLRRLLDLPPVRQVMIFCQTYAPHEVRVLEPSAYFTDADSDAWRYNHQCLERFARCLNEFGEAPWPDYRLTPQDIYTGSAGSPRHAVGLPSSYDKRLAA